jgi:Plant transposon protein
MNTSFMPKSKPILVTKSEDWPAAQHNGKSSFPNLVIHTWTSMPMERQTLVKFDDLARSIPHGKFSDLKFSLRKRQGSGFIRECYQVAWLIVNNGYLDWAITVPPFKDMLNRKQYLFSQWLECLGKDVECTFGILKDW